ncbi:MAG: flagellar hook-basal body complex protein [Clostridia bacterium]|nr:flagellar hook-basal body complex protein [Clostridia bacterium]
MIRGLYIAGNNMVVNTNKLDVLSNNLANVDTAGYKKDLYASKGFNEVLISKFNGTDARAELPFDKITVEKNGEDFKVSTDWGYFRVATDNGLSHNKDAAFTVDPDGYLSTFYLNSDRTKDWNYGDKIVGTDGQPIYVGDGEVTISEAGEVMVDGSQVASLVYEADQDVIGTMSAGVKANRILTDFTQGNLQQTARAQDVAIRGEGFFTIETEFGDLYTRNGSFHLDGNGELKTSDGYSVQGLNGTIKLENDSFQVNELGEIIVDGTLVDKLKLVNFSNTGDLVKIGGSFFRAKNEMQGEMVDFDGEIAQGYIENSNASVINEMIRMISLSRNYESGQKVVSTIDEAIGKAISDVGTLG